MAAKTTHGASRKGPLYRTFLSWRNAKSRCSNPKVWNFKDYGGRGISVCERWLHSFENFLADMGRKPDGATLERKDVNGHYCKENCVWATWKQQANNRRNNHRIQFQGEFKTVGELVSELNLPKAFVGRFYVGWSLEKTLSTPFRASRVKGLRRKYRARITVNGKRITVGRFYTKEEKEEAVEKALASRRYAPWP